MTRQQFADFELWLVAAGSTPKVAATVSKYTHYAREFVAQVGEPRTATVTQIAAWQQALRLSPLGISAQNSRLAAVRALFTWAIARNLRKDNPLVGVLQMRRLPKRRKQFVDRGVLATIFDTLYAADATPECLQDRALLESLYGSGLRRDEAGRLTLGNFVGRHQLRLIGKGNKERLTIVTDAQYHAVRAWALHSLQDERSLAVSAEYGEDTAFEDLKRRFPTRCLWVTEGQVDVSTLKDPGHWVWRRVRGCAETAGVPKLRAHQLRHSFATHLLGSGQVQLTELQDMMGHEDISTTADYAGIEGLAYDRARAAHPRGLHVLAL